MSNALFALLDINPESAPTALDWLLLYGAVISVLLLGWGYTRYRDKTDDEDNLIKHGRPFLIAFRPLFIFIGSLEACFILPDKARDDVAVTFVVSCGVALFIGGPLFIGYRFLQEFARKRQEKIDEAMGFDTRQVHGTAGIATPNEQRQAGL